MNDTARARLALWTAAQSDRDLCALLAEITDLRKEQAQLHRRLDTMREERDRAQRALRQPSVYGALVALWDVITGRASWS